MSLARDAALIYLTYGPPVLISASDLTFEIPGPWGHLLGLVMFGVAFYLAYRTYKRYRGDR